LSRWFKSIEDFAQATLLKSITTDTGFVFYFFCDTQKFSITLFRIFFFSRTWWWRMNGKKKFKIVRLLFLPQYWAGHPPQNNDTVFCYF
jgi:hypothetical protein